MKLYRVVHHMYDTGFDSKLGDLYALCENLYMDVEDAVSALDEFLTANQSDIMSHLVSGVTIPVDVERKAQELLNAEQQGSYFAYVLKPGSAHHAPHVIDACDERDGFFPCTKNIKAAQRVLESIHHKPISHSSVVFNVKAPVLWKRTVNRPGRHVVVDGETFYSKTPVIEELDWEFVTDRYGNNIYQSFQVAIEEVEYNIIPSSRSNGET